MTIAITAAIRNRLLRKLRVVARTLFELAKTFFIVVERRLSAACGHTYRVEVA